MVNYILAEEDYDLSKMVNEIDEIMEEIKEEEKEFQALKEKYDLDYAKEVVQYLDAEDKKELLHFLINNL